MSEFKRPSKREIARMKKAEDAANDQAWADYQAKAARAGWDAMAACEKARSEWNRRTDDIRNAFIRKRLGIEPERTAV
jgi:hypothetical protein